MRTHDRSAPHYVYRPYNARGRLLYVGLSANPERRLNQHSYEQWSWHWFGVVAALGIERCENWEAARAVEREAIRTEWPLWNIHEARDMTLIRLVQKADSEAWHREFEKSVLGGRPLAGAARASHEARLEREFNEQMRHLFLVRRLARRAMVTGYATAAEVGPVYLSAD